ncbi:hypothetical protein [Hymenobacter sp. BRD67]|nr:hypothetical protein [Hymenobacter sp. BRD67]
MTADTQEGTAVKKGGSEATRRANPSFNPNPGEGPANAPAQ